MSVNLCVLIICNKRNASNTEVPLFVRVLATRGVGGDFHVKMKRVVVVPLRGHNL